MFDYLIVGSGLSSIAAALELKDLNLAIVDVGDKKNVPRNTVKSLVGALKEKNVKFILGENFESIHKRINGDHLGLKLILPQLSHFLNGETFQINNNNITRSSGSQSVGGMSNVWGGQFIRYINEDFDQLKNWPIRYNDLLKFYNKIEDHVGVSGENKNYKEFYFSQPTFKNSTKKTNTTKKIFKKYRSLSENNMINIKLYEPRLALLTEDYRGYKKHKYEELELFSHHKNSLYSSNRSLDELEKKTNIQFFYSSNVISFDEKKNGIRVKILNKNSGKFFYLHCKNLLIGAGVVNTARIVFNSLNINKLSLPFNDHQPYLLPFFSPSNFNLRIPKKTYPNQFNVFDKSENTFMSFYYPGANLISNYLLDLPFSLPFSYKFLKSIMSGFYVAQVWNGFEHTTRNCKLYVNKQSMVVNDNNLKSNIKLKNSLKELRKIGLYTSRLLLKRTRLGHGYHFFGTFPMSSEPKKYTTDTFGKLHGTNAVRIIDASIIPSLSYKNHSLVMMANAARIASHLLEQSK